MDYQSDYNKNDGKIPQACSYSFQSSKVTYGGIDGAYYTTTRTRRQGNDGVSKPYSCLFGGSCCWGGVVGAGVGVWVAVVDLFFIFLLFSCCASVPGGC